MKKAGFERSVQCREKAKKLKTEYRKIKDKHRVTGTGRKKWKHYDTLDAVLGDRPATLQPVIVDTLQESIESASETDLDNSTENDIHGEQSSNESIVTATEISDQRRESPSDDDQTELSPSSKSLLKTKNLKKRNKGHWVEKVVETMTEKLIAATAESDKRFIELEERRMIFEKEEKDREERQRKLCSSQQNTFHFPS